MLYRMSFQKIVLIIAIVILLIILVVIGVTLSKLRIEEWPPTVGECPDYWVDMSGNGEACFNSKSLGRCNKPDDKNKNEMNFNQSRFTGNDGNCAKYRWATTCGVTWYGITSGVKNPCDTSS